MNEDRIAKLTDSQRDCLRLVYLNLKSKEIGRKLGISNHTVDMRLRVAMQTLGVTNRYEAARMLHLGEGSGSYQPLVYQPPQLSPAATSDDAQDVDQQGEPAQEVIALPQGFPLPFPTRGRKTNDLSSGQRLLWIAGIAFFAALSFGMVIAGLEALSRIL